MKDYFPLKAGTKSVYSFKSTEFNGEALVSIVILKVNRRKDKDVAHARMTTKLKGHETSVDYEITKSKTAVTTCDGIVVGGRTEFILPLKEGAKWNEYPDANEIVSLTDKLKFNNEKYEDCLKIVTSIAGGESGTSVRYYAPELGYVHEIYDAEDMHCEVTLLSVAKATAEEIKEQKRNVASISDEDMPLWEEDSQGISQKTVAKAKAKPKKAAAKTKAKSKVKPKAAAKPKAGVKPKAKAKPKTSKRLK